MWWLDFWPMPWALYEPTTLRVLLATSLALLLLPFVPLASIQRRVERHRLGVAADLRLRDLA